MDEKTCIQPLLLHGLKMEALEAGKFCISASITYNLPRGNYIVKLVTDDKDLVLDEICIVRRPKEKRGQKRILSQVTESNKRPHKTSSQNNNNTVTAQMVDIAQT